jgi:hypothetical protein
MSVICVSVIRPISVYLEMLVVFVVSVCTATANSCDVNFLFKCWNCDMKARLQVTAENVKMCSYFHIGNNPYQQDVS